MKCKMALAILLIGSFNATYGQEKNTSLTGKVTDANGKSLSFANIYIDSLSLRAISDSSGSFVIRNVPSGRHTLETSAVGYHKNTQTIVVPAGSRNMTVNIRLTIEAQSLEQVTVAARTETQKIKQTGFNVNVIETKKFENSTVNVSQILNQTTGVRIRETGGVGSEYSFFLNGLSGRQVKFFLNGEPLENYGSVFNLNNIPVNLVERIEVYKGAVPVNLGADALGGAINIVTKQNTRNYLDASYSIGSFNTHAANLNGQWRDSSSGFTLKPQFLFNYSDNNYKMYDLKTKRDQYTDTTGDFRRFHDTYRSYFSSIEFGFTRKSWADKLLLGIGYGRVHSDIQTGSAGSKNQDGTFNLPVAGEIYAKERTEKYSLQYAKNKLLAGKMNVTLYASYNTLNSDNVDTSNNQYNWKGEIIGTQHTSEFNVFKTYFRYKQKMFLQSTGITYQLHENHLLTGNFVWSNIKRQGRNIVSNNGDDPFRDPNTLDKKVTGLAYQNTAFNGKLQTIVSAKYYDMNILARESRQYVFGQFTIVDLRTNQRKLGGGIASSFKKNNWLAKASYEYAYRLPEAYELFGDGLRVLANPELMPENSNNINVGGSYRFNLGKAGKLSAEVNGFMRFVDNMIFVRQGGNFLQYQNVQKIFIRGVEAEAAYQYKDRFNLTANVTYQDVLNNNEYVENSSIPNFVYRDRMYNTPYFFGNLESMFSFLPVGKQQIKIGLLYSINYVSKFYLNYPSIALGGTKFTVPTQFVQNAGISFSLPDNLLNLSLECRNLADSRAYDNYALQKPGRSFYAKLRYFFIQ